MIKVFLASLACWRFNTLALAALVVLFAAPVRSEEEPGARALEQHQMMRQQQQDAVRLRMQQQQRSVASPPASARERQELERLQIQQQQRQQQLHYRQGIEPLPIHPADDAGLARAKGELKRQEALREGEAQRRRLDAELQQHIQKGRVEKARGEIRSPEAPATLR